MTVIYTSHYMEEVQALCRRIAILDDGRLLACDTLPNLLKMLDGRVRFTRHRRGPGFGDASWTTLPRREEGDSRSTAGSR